MGREIALSFIAKAKFAHILSLGELLLPPRKEAACQGFGLDCLLSLMAGAENDTFASLSLRL